MRRSETQKLGDVLKDYVKALKIDKKLKEVEIVNFWEELVGKIVARRTKDVYIKNKILFVILRSSVVRNELFMIKDELLKRLNEKAGEEILKDIVFK